ncbi:MAG: VOC family protein [Pyrinomonadaceae bacterium]
MIGVKPYVAFPGNCEEAVNFYKDALDAELLYLERYGDSPMAEHAPEGSADKVIHCTLRIGDTHLMACDSMMPAGELKIGNNVTLAVGLDDADAAARMFDRLAEGGSVTMPMQETYWAERFGMLTDKFGINWMFNVEKPHGSMLETN